MTTTTTVILYCLIAVSALGVYLLMPKTGRSTGVAGAFFGLGGLVGLCVLLFVKSLVPPETGICFCIFSAIAIFGAARVVTHPRPVYSAIYFVLVIMAVAALLILQGAEFLAAALVIIYAGAIMVTYVFVIMLAQQGTSSVYDRNAREPMLAILCGLVLAGLIAGRADDLTTSTVAIEQSQVATAADETTLLDEGEGTVERQGNTLSLGAVLMTKYVVALEVAGLLLLIAMVGAVALTRKRVAPIGVQESAVELGRIGKEVEPY